jgi:hypothetical protein
MIKSRFLHSALALVFGLGFAACDSDSSEEDTFTGDATLVEDVAADPATGRDPVTGQPVGTTGHFTLFSFADNQIVSSGANFSASDSASANWDIGFRGTTIIINGGTSGPGDGGVIVREGIFEDLADAPTTGYAVDSASGYGVPSGSGNGWYNYNPAAMVLSPIPGRFLIVRTADGKYAKVRILNYYQGNPDPVDPFTDLERFYTFEYVYQPDGSTKLSAD